MNAPPMLVGLAVLFWGWQAGLLAFAAPLAALLEGSRLVKARWDFSDADYGRIWTLCVVLFAGVAVYAFTSNDGAGAVGSFFNTNNPAVRNDATSLWDALLE